MAALGLGATELDDGGGEGERRGGKGWCEEEPLDRVDRDTRLKEIMQTVHATGMKESSARSTGSIATFISLT